MRRHASPSGSPEDLLRSLSGELRPDRGLQKRIKGRLQARMAAPEFFTEVKEALVPPVGLPARLWARIARQIEPLQPISLWSRLRHSFEPAADLQSLIKARIFGRLQPAHAPAFVRPLKWAAAFAVLLLLVRLSPLVFLAHPSIAESTIVALPTAGESDIVTQGLSQPFTSPLTITRPVTLQTHDGEMTIAFYNSAIVRLGHNTTVTLRTIDQPTVSSHALALSLDEGKIWVLGLMPNPLQGLAIGTPYGNVTINEGSASIEETAHNVLVRVWDRGTAIERHGKQLTLVEGRQMALDGSAALAASTIDPSAYQDSWVSANLADDAVHRRELAQMQQERLAAAAGILPTSPLYPAKRFAESVEVFLALNPTDRARKIIDNANARLSEAAALLSQGSGSVATATLKEYHDTVLSVATASGADKTVTSLLQQEVMTKATADTAAALPDDQQAYALKAAVRDTIASLPSDLPKPDVNAAALLDELTVVKQQVQQGEVQSAKVKLAELTPSLSAANDPSVPPDVKQEVSATLSSVDAAVQQGEEQQQQLAQELGGKIISLPISSDGNVERTVPVIRPSQPAVEPLTDAQIEQRAQQIRGRIFIFGEKRSRLNELRQQILFLQNDPYEGPILHHLYSILPGDGLAQYVRREITNLNAVHNKELPPVSSSGAAM